MTSKCPTGKRRYVSAVEAAQNLHRCKQLGRGERGYYECKRCEWWHLTSQDPATIGMTLEESNGD